MERRNLGFSRPQRGACDGILTAARPRAAPITPLPATQNALPMASHQHVPFLTVEDEDDWVVSFALGPLGTSRLTLTRTPRLEFMLSPEQRGVSVGCAEAGQRPALLVAVQWGQQCVDVVSTAKRYSLDIRKVDGATRAAALSVLGKMNFDQRFQLGSA